MQFSEFSEIIKRRANIDDEWYDEVEKCHKKMVEIFSSNIAKTILFLDVCTADEFSWLSEVFDEIAQKTKSKNFIDALRKTAAKYPEETRRYHILDFITSAECMIDCN